MTERAIVSNGHNDNGREGVLIVNPLEQSQVTQALREQVKKAVDWEYQQPCDDLNLWADRVKDRFFDCIVYPDRPPLPDPVIGIEKMRHDTLAAYKLNRNAQGLLYQITINERHFKDENDRKVWAFGGTYGLVETLTHELGHLWQQNAGEHPYREGSNTHNKEFVDRMEAIGVHPKPVTGVHYRQADGMFEKFMKEYGIAKPEMPEGDFDIDWFRFFAEFFDGYKPRGKSTLHKWACPECGFAVNATTRKDINLICGDCKIETGDDIFFVRSERRRPNSHQLKPVG